MSIFPSPPGAWRHPAVTLVCLALTVLTVASCGSKAPVAIVPASSITPVSTVETAAKVMPSTTPVVATTIAATAMPAVVTTVSSGDPVLDAVGTDLAAFEKESDGLSSAAASAQEDAK